MLAKCIRIVLEEGGSFKVTGIDKDEESRFLGSGCYFQNLKNGAGRVIQANKILIIVETDNGLTTMSIGDQFKSRFKKNGKSHANLSKKRMEKIKSTMPKEVNIVPTEEVPYPYKVEDAEIDAWFLRL